MAPVAESREASPLSGSRSDAQRLRELVERVAASRHFCKSLRQKQLLLFLVNHAIEAPDSEIHEQEIGIRVFDRPPGYDTAIDTIVRVNAYELRKRLDAYFSAEGKNEPTVIELPKGSYRPVFRERQVPSPKPPGSIALATSAPVSHLRRLWYPVILAAISICLAGGLCYQNLQLRHRLTSRNLPPVLDRLWSRLFTEGHQTDIVLADSNLSLLQDLLPVPLPPGSYFNRSDVLLAIDAVRNAESRHMLLTLMSRRYTSMADVHTLQRILLLSGPDGRRIHVHFAREFSPDDLKTSNIILLGSKRSNPWVRFFEEDLVFHFEQDPQSGYEVVINTHPQPNEQPRYKTVAKDAMLESYGLVAFLPNLARTGNVLLLEGAGMHATESAGELVTQENLLAPVIGSLTAHRAALPYFEVLFETRVMGASMEVPQIISVRVHNGPGDR